MTSDNQAPAQPNPENPLDIREIARADKLGEYVDNGLVVSLGNFDWGNGSGTHVASDGSGVSVLFLSEGAERFNDAVKEASKSFGSDQIAHGPGTDAETGKVLSERKSGNVVGLYTTKVAFEQSGQDFLRDLEELQRKQDEKERERAERTAKILGK